MKLEDIHALIWRLQGLADRTKVRESMELARDIEEFLSGLARRIDFERDARRTAEFQKAAMKLAPALINSMAGKEIFPLAAVDSELIDAIAELATGDDIVMLANLLHSQLHGERLAAYLIERFAHLRLSGRTGPASVPSKPAPMPSDPAQGIEDTRLLNDVLRTVTASQIDMLVSVLGEGHPGIAQRLKDRHAQAWETATVMETP